ncbi:helix-turn-helix domain-containing protein [Bradyrhizobium sp. Y36]|uniref:helix-turn-helix domain-containing protein n=1 Tax=Bradyrhizobium sp. Y36 TaxID=2035447 RepID=UPI0032DE4414
MKYRGRKPTFDKDQLAVVRNMLEQSAGVGQIAAATGLSRQTVYRIKDDPAGAEAALRTWAA